MSATGSIPLDDAKPFSASKRLKFREEFMFAEITAVRGVGEVLGVLELGRFDYTKREGESFG